MISREKAQTYLDTILEVLKVVNDLCHDKLFPAEVALTGIKAALATLDDETIAQLEPDEVRAIATRLKNEITERNKRIDAKLDEKFPIGED